MTSLIERLTLAAAYAIALAAIVAATAFVLQDALFLAGARPPAGAPAAPAPDYAQEAAWAARPQTPKADAAAIFYVHPTTDFSGAAWNASVSDPAARNAVLRLALPLHTGALARLGDLYAPLYRQATGYAMLTAGADSAAALKTAYGDVAAAFQAFLAAAPEDAPIVVIGYEQGGLHVLRLIQDFFSDDAALGRLAAAYVIDQPALQDGHAPGARRIPVCTTPNAVRCLAAWASVDPGDKPAKQRLRQAAPVWTNSGDVARTSGRPLICVNPLSWTVSDEHAPAALHMGALALVGPGPASASGQARPLAFSEAVGARCADGLLALDRIRIDSLKRRIGYGAQWRLQPRALFQADVAANVTGRLAALRKAQEEARMAPPLGGAMIDILDSPINTVPD